MVTPVLNSWAPTGVRECVLGKRIWLVPLREPLPAAKILCFDIYRFIELIVDRLFALALPVTVETGFE